MQPPAPIQLFGIVGVDFDAASLQAQLDPIPRDTPLLVRINSDGGSVREAVAMYATLVSWPGGVDTEVVGWALSAASLLFMAGRARRMHPTSMVMLHAPWTDQSGNAQQMRQQAELLDAVALSMRSAYARSGQPAATVAGWLDGKSDHWFVAAEALSAGLATEIIPTAAAQAAIPHNVYAQRHSPPAHITRLLPMTTPTTSTQPQPDTVNAAAIRAEAIRAEGLRRDDIRAQFQNVGHMTGLRAEMGELQARCESDLACTAAVAGQRILALMARDVTPANGGGGGARFEYGADNQRMGDFSAAATDVLMARAGFKVAEPHPGAKDLQRMSIVAMTERMLSMAGVSTRDLSKSEIIRAGMSTSDLPSLLSNLAGKSMRTGYATAPATFTGWTGEREVPDFKLQTLVALSEAPGLLLVPELSEYKHGYLTDSASTFKVDPHGRLLLMSRQMMVNDDLSAFTNIPAAFGQSARRLEADKVYGLLTDNPLLGDGVALFHANHGNLAPAASTPTVAALGEARAAMRKQKDIAGSQYIDPQPRFLIVPVALETACEQLLASLIDPNRVMSSAPTVEWIRGLDLIADPRLDAASAVSWYLAADPRQVEGIVRAYLQGEDRPHLEDAPEFARDAVAKKARLDFGVGVIDYRGLYKNPGA